jgi:hypothetical protein
MLRFCVSWRVPRLSFLPITVIGRVALLGGDTVPMCRYPSNDFLRRVARGFLEVGEWKSCWRRVSALSYRHKPKDADVELRVLFVVGGGKCTVSYRPVKGSFGFFL